MAPTKEKPKHIRKAPEFIDKDFIATLPKDKQAYWNRRQEGKNGQEDTKPKPKLLKSPENQTIGFNNEGQMIIRTRAMRRNKPASDVKYTKKTHSIIKARKR